MVPADTSIAVRADDLSIARTSGRMAAASRVVDGVSFELRRGRSLIIMGPTGSGKSSLAASLAGQADEHTTVAGGDAVVEGISIRRPGRKKRQLTFYVGYLGQGDASRLSARSTVGEIVGAPVTGRDRRANTQAVAMRTAKLLDELGLPLGVAAKYPYELSSGMRQRVVLARALMLEPRTLVADDIFANLDVDSRHLVLDAVTRRQEERSMSSIIVSNDGDSVRTLDPFVLVLRAGYPVAYGQGAENLLWTPSAASDARIVGSVET